MAKYMKRVWLNFEEGTTNQRHMKIYDYQPGEGGYVRTSRIHIDDSDASFGKMTVDFDRYCNPRKDFAEKYEESTEEEFEAARQLAIEILQKM